MKNIKFEINKNQVGIITLNRPNVRNAFNSEMIAEMTQFFKSVGDEQGVRALVLQGAGDSFSAGGDLNWMKSMVDFTKEENVDDSKKLYEMYEALRAIPLPVIALVHGHAMGGALGLIAACDIAFAAEGTQFCFSEVRLGLAPAVISAFIKEKVHRRDIQRYFLTAEMFEPMEAFDMGLIHGFGERESVAEKVFYIARKISKNSPAAVRATKKMISEIYSTKDLKKTTTELIAELRVSDEGQEGLKAFLQKRKPAWLEADRG